MANRRQTKKREEFFDAVTGRKSSQKRPEGNFSEEIKSEKPRSSQLYEQAEKAYFTGEEGIGKVLMDEASNAAKEEAEERKEERGIHLERRKKFISDVDASEATINNRESDLNVIQQSLDQSGDYTHVRDFLADKFNLPMFKTPGGVALSTATKQLYVSSLSSIPGSRPNMWIERFLGDTVPKIGQKKLSNQVALDIAKFNLDLEKKRNELARDIEMRLSSEGKNIPHDIHMQVGRELKNYAQEKEQRLKYSLQSLYEKDAPRRSFEVKPVTPGTPLTKEKGDYFFSLTDPKESPEKREEEARKKAKKLGYWIPE